MLLPINLAGITPMMRQYIEVKREHQDSILFYRLGDFYEMFFDDAVTASGELDLVLTGRECGLKEKAPMCGIPYHSSEGYIARLIKKGYKVAICEQVEDPALAKGLVKREVIQVVTPGTVIDSSMLSEETNNYIASLYLSKKSFGLCFLDVTTGSISMTHAKSDVDTIMTELARFSPKEVLMNEAAFTNQALKRFAEKNIAALVEQIFEGYFTIETTKQILEQLPFETVSTTDGPVHDGHIALCGLMKYLNKTHYGAISRLIEINEYRCEEYLSIPPESRRSLELTETLRSNQKQGSLLWVIDKTTNSMGKRLIKSFLEKPLTDPSLINERLDSTEQLYSDNVMLLKLRDSLAKISDIERLMTRVIYRSCSPRDLLALSDSIKEIAKVKEIGSQMTISSRLLVDAFESLDILSDLEARIDSTIVELPPATLKDGGYIKESCHAEIGELREILHNSKNYLLRMENEIKEQTGIRTLKVGYNRVFGYYIEVTNSSKDLVPLHFVRKQTLVNSERYITEELKDLESRILGANERLNLLEREIFEELRVEVERNLMRIQRNADSISLLDVLGCFATLAIENNYARPTVDESGVIYIKSGRHPVVEQLNRVNELFVPNDTYLDTRENLVNIITGPNMSGKSTYMRQTALIVILAQMGCFVPAREAQIGVVDAIFTRIGASDDIFSGDSTFMIEMKEISHIFAKATKKSLLILDEVGRGTSTYDGMSIARAVIEAIASTKGLGAKTMFATHYHELTILDSLFANIKNYNIAARKRDDEIVFLRRIVHGPSDDSYGIEVAKLAGVPDSVIERAKEVLLEIEMNKGYTPVIKKDDGSSASEHEYIMQKLKVTNPENLTPIEAMYLLNELATLARKKGE
ncbi:MAG: DNA mismatch repair protein MutS [Oscillospiraceae bacterium]|nr:DNA mismatch repair protein MutS [Oscillospiraceae bacterium]